MGELPVTEQPGNGELVRVWHEPIPDGGVVVHAVGEIDMSTAPHLTEELAGVEEELSAPGPLVIDLTEVTFLASAGLSALVSSHEHCGRAGVALRVVTGNRSVARSIQMTGLTEMLDVYDTLEDALHPSR